MSATFKKGVLAVAHKETLDAARDRRSLITVLSYVLFAPLFLVLVFNALAKQESVAAELEIAARGVQALPGLEAALLEQDIRLRVSDDPEAEVRGGTAKVGIDVVSNDSLTGSLASGQPVELRLISNDSKVSDSRAARRVALAVQAYSSELVALRVLARGMAPSVLRPIDVQRVDLATSAERAALVLSGFQIFILLAAFIGAMNLVTDMTAGERERRSLEILLAQPAATSAIIVGKWITASAMSGLAVALTIVALMFAMPMMPLDMLGVSYTPTKATLLLMGIAALPLAPLAAALQMIAASFAKSFKEAQMYLSISMMLPIGLTMAAEFMKPEPASWMLTVPLLAQQQLMDASLKGNAPDGLWFVIAAICVLLLSAVFVWITVRLHEREAILQTS